MMKKITVAVCSLALAAGGVLPLQNTKLDITQGITASAYYRNGASFTCKFTTENNKRILKWPLSSGTSGYNKISSSWSDGGRNHGAIDIAAASGANVLASAAGTVDTVCTDGWGGGYGNYVILKHNINGATYYTQYSHLSSVKVSKNQSVNQGTTIGCVGNTGESYGAHLDFQVKKRNVLEGSSTRMTQNIDPMTVVCMPGTVIDASTDGTAPGYSDETGNYLYKATTTDQCPAAFKTGGTVQPPISNGYCTNEPYVLYSGANYHDTSIACTLSAANVWYRPTVSTVRQKNNTTSVYVTIASGGSDASSYRCCVKGMTDTYRTGTGVNKTLNRSGYSTSYVTLSRGCTYQIQNLVKEHGYPYATLDFAQTAGSNKRLAGYWSPDSTGTYTKAN